ncbi:MAG TPA: GntR family transcriptional regulator [Dongiaceae bacterium]|nr:GntR family transcriptional regulator [Dongiaceae bacterium]
MAKRTGADFIAADVHRTLRSKIITLELRPGTRLVEDEISANLKVGRTPVREALLRLQGEGLVSRDRGWIVQWTEPSSVPMVFESRAAIEGYATRVAALRITGPEVRELQKLVSEMDRADQPRSQLNACNRAFHRKIVAISGNSLFIEMHERTQFHYWNLRLPVVFTKEQTDLANEQHKEILAALAAGDADAAEGAARKHIESTFTIVREALEGL